MARRRKKLSSRTLWLMVHLGGPVFPLVIKSLIRYISYPRLRFDILDASDLALISVFIWLFVRQSLIDKEITLVNDDKKEELRTCVNGCFGGAIVFFAFYLLMEVFTTLVEGLHQTNNQPSLDITKWLVFVSFVVSMLVIFRIQQSFKLKARI